MRWRRVWDSLLEKGVGGGIGRWSSPAPGALRVTILWRPYCQPCGSQGNPGAPEGTQESSDLHMGNYGHSNNSLSLLLSLTLPYSLSSCVSVSPVSSSLFFAPLTALLSPIPPPSLHLSGCLPVPLPAAITRPLLPAVLRPVPQSAAAGPAHDLRLPKELHFNGGETLWPLQPDLRAAGCLQ